MEAQSFFSDGSRLGTDTSAAGSGVGEIEKEIKDLLLVFTSPFAYCTWGGSTSGSVGSRMPSADWLESA